MRTIPIVILSLVAGCAPAPTCFDSVPCGALGECSMCVAREGEGCVECPGGSSFDFDERRGAFDSPAEMQGEPTKAEAVQAAEKYPVTGDVAPGADHRVMLGAEDLHAHARRVPLGAHRP